MSGIPGTAVVQITNLSSAVSSDQMRTLFGFLGDIEELRLYPPDNAPLSFSSKVCYVKYREPSSVGVAQHLTNTVFIDRALIVVPCAEGKIPEEAKALSMLAPAVPSPGLVPGGGLLPIPTPAPPVHNQPPQLSLPVANLVALPTVLDHSLTALAGGSSSQPPLMGNVDPSKVDEIRRTVYVGNLNSQTTTAEQLLEFFKQVGDVKFVRMAGDETQPTRFAFVEFADQDSVSRALNFNGVMFGDRPLKINHSNNAIVKPPELTPQAAAKELEDVMKRVREAQSTIAAAIEPEDEKKPSPSHSKRSRQSHSSSRSRSRTRRKRSRSSHRSKPIQRSRPRLSDRHSSRSSGRRPSRSRDRRPSRSRSRDRRKDKDVNMRGKVDGPQEKGDRRQKETKGRAPADSSGGFLGSGSAIRDHRRRSRERSRSPRRKARSPTPKRGRKEKRRERASEISRGRRERSTSRKKSNREQERTERRAKPAKVKVESDRAGRDNREDSATPSEDVMSSPCARHNGSHSTYPDDDITA
ncbi:splicing regulatory glutamine/lysine-rich protein 1 isoform X2 [Hypomesus transpacificus]|uniref:splicing regulatory glutamine/lysine-rich protein 1 isoform X2 n=1 Tax=Hypomesus transpacificus TaxID=137520 RepID=UPI001F07FAC9|nr:splicing regulatory glutamine/lysine-rich protein 1 isoform X2 [Hypomesus transpacificus]